MKKIVIILLAVTVAFGAVCLASCEKDEYKSFNDMLATDYSSMTLEISTKGAVELNASFAFNYHNGETTVGYSYDKVATIDKVNGEYILPEKYIVTLKGNVVYKDGKIVSQNGDPVDADVEKLSEVGLTFDKAYFNNASFSGNTFSAEVINPKGFTGDTSLRCMGMRVTLTYKPDVEYTINNGSTVEIKVGPVLQSLQYSYVTDKEEEVSVKYSFTK